MVPPGYGAAYWRRGSWRRGVAGRMRVGLYGACNCRCGSWRRGSLAARFRGLRGAGGGACQKTVCWPGWLGRAPGCGERGRRNGVWGCGAGVRGTGPEERRLGVRRRGNGVGVRGTGPEERRLGVRRRGAGNGAGGTGPGGTASRGTGSGERRRGTGDCLAGAGEAVDAGAGVSGGGPWKTVSGERGRRNGVWEEQWPEQVWLWVFKDSQYGISVSVVSIGKPARKHGILVRMPGNSRGTEQRGSGGRGLQKGMQGKCCKKTS